MPEGQSAWRAGETASLRWIVGTDLVTVNGPPRPITLTAELQGPYATVDALKGGAAAATSLSAPALHTDDQNPAAQTSRLALPSNFAPGLYNLTFEIDYGDGNGSSGSSVVQLGVSGSESDPLAALRQRPLDFPKSTSTAGCPTTPVASIRNTMPDYGSGPGPVYLTGQSDWYSGGQVVALLIDASYTGPLLVRTGAVGDGNGSQITLTDLPSLDMANITAKEAAHSVAVMSAVHTADGELELPAGTERPSWRAWFGSMSAGGAGCFAMRVDGTVFSEVIVFDVHNGPAPLG